MSASSRFAHRLALVDAERHGWLCFYCGKDLTPMTTTADHRVPKSKGGQVAVANIIGCCLACNMAKADTEKHPHWTVEDGMRETCRRTMPDAGHPLAFYYLGLAYAVPMPPGHRYGSGDADPHNAS